MNVDLPAELDRADLIAAKAMQSESYLMAVESIAKRARYLARHSGRAALSLADVETAIEETSPPTSPASPRKMRRETEPLVEQPTAVKRGRSAKSVTATLIPGMEAPQRETTLEPQPA